MIRQLQEPVERQVFAPARWFTPPPVAEPRWLEKAEVRSRSLLEEITTTGERLLATLEPQPEATARAS